MIQRTPEELVRQTLLGHLIGEFGCPSSLISVEISLGTLSSAVPRGIKHRRADIVCFAPIAEGAYPLLLIECKHKTPSISVLSQLLGYNLYIASTVVAVAWSDGIAMYTKGSLLYKGPQVSMPSYRLLQELLP